MEPTQLLGFGINFFVALLIVRFIYYPQKPNKNFVISLFSFNTIMFFMMSVLSSTGISVGAGFGLFAVLSILRYRTNPMSVRDMTYLLVLIVLPILNASLGQGIELPSMLFANGVIIVLLFVLEKEWGFEYEQSKSILYERIELVALEKRPELIADLQARTGLPIRRIQVGKLDYLRDSAELKVYFLQSDIDNGGKAAETDFPVIYPGED